MVKVYISDKTAFPTSESYIINVLERFYEISRPTILRTENGKPYIEGSPVHFSLSHTKEKLFLAVAPLPIGVDAEKSDRKIDQTVAKRYFSAVEFSSEKALLEKWLETESQVKFLGSTLHQQLTIPTKEEVFFSFHETNGHTICVCYGEPVSIEYIEL